MDFSTEESEENDLINLVFHILKIKFQYLNPIILPEWINRG